MISLFRNMIYLILMGTTACASYGQVLCYGVNGHTAIETAFHDHCGHEHGHEHHEGHSGGEHYGEILAETCHPCIDLPLGNDALESDQTRLPFSTEQFCATVTVDHCNNVPCLSHVFAHEQSFAFFTHLKVIVLLI
ncbi:MAG: hypothetical protein KAS23_01935 [Anaerohalosphaera sp.]|nr:hypothetical protein [Anaerohalosphaera sp.]